MRRAPLLLAAAVALFFQLSAVPSPGLPVASRPVPARTQVLDIWSRADVNEISMSVTNIGSFAFDIPNGGPGLEFPKGSGKTAAFAGGLWLGAQVGGETRVTVAEYSTEYLPGAIIDGAPDLPHASQYRVFKLNRSYANASERDEVLADYNQNAVPYGAPQVLLLTDGTLSVHGDQMLWCVYNDADPTAHNAAPGGTTPLGVEIQQTVFAYNRPGPLGRTVFVRYRIANKGQNVLEDLHASLWLDPDIGDPFDDFAGCHPTSGLGFCYDLGSDGVYGGAPPALGVQLHSSGQDLGINAFTVYVNGTDPNNAFESFNYMRGLLADGSPIINPVWNSPSPFFYNGNPVTGLGWNDLVPADKRMALTTRGLTLPPGGHDELFYSIVIGSGPNGSASLNQLFCSAATIRAFVDGGFFPDPPPAECPVVQVCPLTADQWAIQFAGGGDFTDQDLQALVTCMDESSTTLTINYVDGIRSLLDPSNAGTPAGAAMREYVALLANACASQLGLPATEPLSLDLTAPVACEGLQAQNVHEVLVEAVEEISGEYLNQLPNRRALEGINWSSLPALQGGLGAMADFLGSGPDPYAQPQSFPTVEIRFGEGTQLAYRYLRLQQEDGSAPANGREYRYAGFRPVPFTCWDVTNGVQLDVAFVERAITDFEGTLLPSWQQTATFDSTWGPDASFDGAREYMMVALRSYSGDPHPDYAVDFAPISGAMLFSYAFWGRLRTEFDVIDPGDRLRFTFDVAPSPGVDAALLLLGRRPPEDPDVIASYQQVASCLQGINGGPCCDDTQPPTLSVSASPGLLWPPKHGIIPVQITAQAQDACDPAPSIRLISVASDEPDGGLGPEDLPGDIEGADLGTSDFALGLRAERDDAGDGRTYQICYEARDARGNATTACATVDVPHDRRGTAHLAAGTGEWTLIVHGAPNMPARSVVGGSIVVRTASRQVKVASAATYVDLDNDQHEDARFTLAGALDVAEVAASGAAARWTAGGSGWLAEIGPQDVTGVPGGEDLPAVFHAVSLPNPARGEAQIHYALPREGHVRVRVFDVGGREVATLVNGIVPAGRHAVRFRPGAPQIYLYRVEWEGKSQTGRFAVLR